LKNPSAQVYGKYRIQRKLKRTLKSQKQQIIPMYPATNSEYMTPFKATKKTRTQTRQDNNVCFKEETAIMRDSDQDKYEPSVPHNRGQ
jgi:hypothetical protein